MEVYWWDMLLKTIISEPKNQLFNLVLLHLGANQATVLWWPVWSHFFDLILHQAGFPIKRAIASVKLLFRMHVCQLRLKIIFTGSLKSAVFSEGWSHQLECFISLWNGVEEFALGLWINKDILSPDLLVSSFQKHRNQLKKWIICLCLI